MSCCTSIPETIRPDARLKPVDSAITSGNSNLQRPSFLGVSTDSVSSHQKFVNKFSLPFPLLADESHEVAEKYGVWVEKNMYGKKSMGIQRATFLIDKSGKIAAVWPKVKVEGHVAEVASKLTELG